MRTRKFSRIVNLTSARVRILLGHLDGGSGDDILSGSGGMDTLVGGEGNDVMTGGGGTGPYGDTFIFAAVNQ
jgi:Ca2+-binding RTX toxin-like protein